MSPPAKPPSLISDLRSLPRAFWVLFAGTFINRFGTFVWPFLTIYLTRQGYTLSDAAWTISSVGAGALFGSLAGGWLADHIGRRNTIVFGSLSAAGSMMLLYYAHGLPMIMLCGLLLGLTSGCYHPAASALLADIVPEDKRVRAYAAFRLAANAGFACGASVGGLIANYSSFWLFAGDALTTVFYCVIALLWLPHGLRAQTKNAPWGEALGVIRRDRAFHIMWIASFCASMVYAQFGTTYSLHVTRERMSLDVFGVHLAPETIYGLLVAYNGVLIVIAELPLTALTLRFNPRRVMALGYALVGVGFGLNAWAHNIAWSLVVMTIFTVGEMISAPTTSALLAWLAPQRLRGRYMGTLALAWNGAGMAGPHFGFALFAIDPRLAFFGSMALGLVAAVITLLSVRVKPLEVAKAPEPAPEPETAAV